MSDFTLNNTKQTGWLKCKGVFQNLKKENGHFWVFKIFNSHHSLNAFFPAFYIVRTNLRTQNKHTEYIQMHTCAPASYNIKECLLCYLFFTSINTVLHPGYKTSNNRTYAKLKFIDVMYTTASTDFNSYFNWKLTSLVLVIPQTWMHDSTLTSAIQQL